MSTRKQRKKLAKRIEADGIGSLTFKRSFFFKLRKRIPEAQPENLPKRSISFRGLTLKSHRNNHINFDYEDLNVDPYSDINKDFSGD